VAVLLATGAWVGAARIAAIDRAPLQAFEGRDVALRGYVVRRERTTVAGRRFRLRVTAVRELRPGAAWRALDDVAQVRIRSETPSPAVDVGDEAIAEGTLERPANRPDSDFDYAAYLRRAGVHELLRASSVTSSGRRRGGLAAPVDAIRRRAERGVGAGMSSIPAELARGMVLGQDENVPAPVVEQFKRSGLAHLLAVSGQNVTLLALLALPLLAALGLGRRGRLAGVLALIALYVPLTGASPSILRAGAMGAAGTVAALAGRPASRWYALLLSAGFTLVLDPRAWLDAGWQLSFAAVVGIFCLARPLTRALARLPEAVASGAAISIAATLATAPLMAFHFERVSLASLPANLLALPAVAPIMWLGMLAAAMAQVSLGAASLLNAINGYFLAYLAEVARWSASWPSAAVPARIGSAWGLCLAYATLSTLAIAVLRRPNREYGAEGPARAMRIAPRLRAAAAVLVVGAAAFTVLVLASGSAANPPARFTISFLDVGQGDAILLQPPGAAVLVDGGPPEADVVSDLRRHGVRALDVAVLTHPQRDHQGGLEQVLRKLPVRLLLDGGGGSPDPTHRRIVALARRAGTHVVRAKAGQAVRVADLRLAVMSPPERFDPHGEDANLQAIVLLASYRGLDTFLPADAESDVTLGLPTRRVEVLKVAHHGSEDEGIAGLLERLRPSVAVIEVGAHNRFGHPRDEVLNALREARARVLRTDLDGEVRVSLGAHGAVVESER
jgi:competence protein ComEC